MPLVGGGGAGNTAGSNPSGTGSSLNYIGNWVSGYSGRVSINDSETALMDFTTGSELIVANVQFFYAVDASSAQNFAYTIKINGEIISKYIVNGSSTYTSANNPILLVLSPFSHVQLLAQNVEDSSSLEQAVTFTGEIQDA